MPTPTVAPTPLPSPEPTATTSPPGTGLLVDWRQRPLDPAFSHFFDFSFSAVFRSGVVFANRFFVIGPTCCDSDDNEIPVIWGSNDGLNWQRADVPDLRTVSLLVAGPGGLIALGDPTEDNTPLWHTPNGTDWTRVVDTDFAGQRIAQVAATGDGFVALGSFVWTSPDGSAWDVASSPSGLLMAASGIQTIVRNSDVLAAFTGGAPTGAPIEVWLSTNLVDWTKLDALAHSSDMETVVAAVGPLGWIVAGSTELENGHRTHRMWLSDGQTSEEVASPVGPVSDVFVDAAGYIAVGFRVIAEGCAIEPYEIQGETWTSVDGQAWTEMPLAPFLYQRIDQLFRDGRTLIGVGLSYDENEGTTARGSVWTARLPDVPPSNPVPSPVSTPEPGGC